MVVNKHMTNPILTLLLNVPVGKKVDDAWLKAMSLDCELWDNRFYFI